MISYQAVLEELAKHIVQAQSAESEAQIREELSAIRALCDVGLHNEMQKSSQPSIIPKMMNTPNPPQKQTSSQIVRNLTTNKLEEDDANGDSIFDF